MVQLWLDGVLTSEQAITLALLGHDPAAKIWAHHLAGAMVVDPKSLVRIVNV